MSRSEPHFHVKLAESQEELEAAQRLRYRVFVQELGSDGPLVDHARGLEADRFDPFFDHLILTCDRRPGEVVSDRLMGYPVNHPCGGSIQSPPYWQHDAAITPTSRALTIW